MAGHQLGTLRAASVYGVGHIERCEFQLVAYIMPPQRLLDMGIQVVYRRVSN